MNLKLNLTLTNCIKKVSMLSRKVITFLQIKKFSEAELNFETIEYAASNLQLCLAIVYMESTLYSQALDNLEQIFKKVSC